MTMVRYTGVVVVIINLFWMAVNLFRNNAMNLASAVTLPVLLALTVYSVVMIFLSCCRIKQLSPQTMQWLLFVFDCLIMITVLVLRVTKNVTIVKNDAVSIYIGVSLSSYYLLLGIISPLPSIRLEVALLAGSVIILFLPGYLPGAEAYNLLQNLILQIVMLILYAVFRRDNMRLSRVSLQAEDLNRQFIFSSYVDELSGLLNRRAYDDYLNHLHDDRSVESVGVFMFDVDNFKSYNDHYSHLKGDEALRDISEAVADEFHGDDVFVFRYGGEEFIVITENPDTDSAEKTANRILTSVRKKAIPRGDVAGFPIVTVTVGYAIEPNTDLATQDMIVRADNALYAGKKAAKNCTFMADRP